MKDILKLIRPHHWVKNMFIFMPLFFGGAVTDLTALKNTLIAFFAYSFAASSIYCYNDIVDLADDRRHADKCKRPIASGKVSVFMGYVLMSVMFILSALMVALLGNDYKPLALVILAYYVLDISYCRYLKRFAVVDVFVLAFGFVLRILAGSAATGIVASHWLVMMTFLLTLLLSFAKRRDDVAKMEQTGIAPRHNTKRYNMVFINQAITITAAVTVICYIMYTISPEVTGRTNFQYVYLTAILVLLGLMRYMQLTFIDGKSGDPTKLLYKDRFLQIVIALWLLSFTLIIYVI